MKTIFIALFILSLIVSSCGGGGSGGSSPIIDGAPQILSISGTGNDGTVMDALSVTGDNFDDSLEIYLVGNVDTRMLTFEIISNTELLAILPIDIEPGDYDLVVENDIGSDSAPLSLLKGEPGDPGISLEHYYSCGPSGNLESDPNIEISGRFAHVYAFNDGSYFIDCMMDYHYISTATYDTSSGVAFYKSSFPEVYGYVECIAMYAHADFYPAENRVRYELNDESNYEDINCIAIY